MEIRSVSKLLRTRVTADNASSLLDVTREFIADTEANVADFRSYLAANPRAFGRTSVQDLLTEERRLLKKLQRREVICSQYE